MLSSAKIKSSCLLSGLLLFASNASATFPHKNHLASAPGTLQFENFDEDSAAGHSYYDKTKWNEGGSYRNTEVDIQKLSSGATVVSFVENGEFLDYTISITKTGNYSFKLKSSNLNATDAKLILSFKKYASAAYKGNILPTLPVSTTAFFNIPITGNWNTFVSTDASTQVPLEKGFYVLRASVSGVSQRYLANLDSITLTHAAANNAGNKIITPQATPAAQIVELPETNDSCGPLFGQTNRVQCKNLTYANLSSGAQLKLNLYMPANASTSTPVVVYLHGGGWQSGSRSMCDWSWIGQRYIQPAVLDSNIALACISYRMPVVNNAWGMTADEQAMPKAPFPAALYDTRAAVRFLRALWGNHNLKIGVWGDSAGGHLAALLGVSKDFDYQAEELKENQNLSFSSSVQAVVDFYGPTDFSYWKNTAGYEKTDPKYNDKAHRSGVIWVINYFMTGKPSSSSSVKEMLADPKRVISKTNAAQPPPLLIEHGTRDAIISLGVSRSFYNAFKSRFPNTFAAFSQYNGEHGNWDQAMGSGRNKIVSRFLGGFLIGPAPSSPEELWK